MAKKKKPAKKAAPRKKKTMKKAAAKKKVMAVPAGYHTVTPYLVSRSAISSPSSSVLAIGFSV